jgi:hypothetical protein
MLSSFHNINAASLVAPSLPPGHHTVASWWVTRERGAFDLLTLPLVTLREEAERVRAFAHRLGVAAVTVAAAPLYAALGQTAEQAYPAELLSDFYPVNP